LKGYLEDLQRVRKDLDFVMEKVFPTPAQPKEEDREKKRVGSCVLVGVDAPRSIPLFFTFSMNLSFRNHPSQRRSQRKTEIILQVV